MQPQGTPDPASAVGSLYSERSDGGVGMERDGSMNGLEGFGELSLERGRTLDVEELDDEGWRIASLDNRIEELGSLGEGAGGAVTKCRLSGGKTIFALKVGFFPNSNLPLHLLTFSDYHNKPRPRCEAPNHSRTQFQQGLRIRPHLPLLRCLR